MFLPLWFFRLVSVISDLEIVRHPLKFRTFPDKDRASKAAEIPLISIKSKR